jgi:hypothetical protein
MPFRPLGRSGMQQPGEPCQWHRYGSPIEKIDTDGVIIDMQIPDTLSRVRFQSSHSMPFLKIPAESLYDNETAMKLKS